MNRSRRFLLLMAVCAGPLGPVAASAEQPAAIVDADDVIRSIPLFAQDRQAQGGVVATMVLEVALRALAATPERAGNEGWRIGANRGTGTESTPRYSINSVAWIMIDGGMVRPNARAVLRVMMKSKRVGCSMGISVGLAPRRIDLFDRPCGAFDL